MSPDDVQARSEDIEKMANQLRRLSIEQKIEIKVGALLRRKAVESQWILPFVDILAASKKWKSRKTTIVWRTRPRTTKEDIGAGVPIELPFTEFEGETLKPVDPFFGIAYRGTDKIVMDESAIAGYEWKWLLQEKL